MRFLIQSDVCCEQEKSAIRLAHALRYGIELKSLSLAQVPTSNYRDGMGGYAPVGTVEFCRAVMARLCIEEPAMPSYPALLAPFLGRKIQAGKVVDLWFMDCDANGEAGELFVKPQKIKLFDGKLVSDVTDDDIKDLPGGTPVWFSERVNFVAEWRVYVAPEKIAVGQYGEGPDEALDMDLVMQAIRAIQRDKNCPCSFALDFGLTDEGKLLLVEMSDAWALGLYKTQHPHTLESYDYANMIYSRWLEISSRITAVPASI